MTVKVEKNIITLESINSSLFLNFSIFIANETHPYNSTPSEYADHILNGTLVNDLFDSNTNIINIGISIGALISGIIILGGLLIPLKNSTLMIATLVVFIFWALKIAYFYVANNLLEPDVITWLQNLSLDCVILMSVWIINRKYS